MKLNNLTKFTTSNLLSLLGYPCILLSIYNEFIFSPLDWADLEGYQYDRDMLGFVSSATSALYFMLACFICAVFFVLILIEFFIRKKNKTEFQLVNKIPDKFKPLYKILFWLGLFFVSPLGPLSMFFLYLFLEKYFNYSELFLRLVN